MTAMGFGARTWNMAENTDYALSVHHIGGRAGTRCFPILPFFERDIVNVLYEADRSSLAGIRNAASRLPSKTIVLGDCLSGSAGPRPFYIYSNRYLSSLYPLLPEHTTAYSFDTQFGWDDDPGGKSLVQTLNLDTLTLDQVVQREAGKVPPPNFLSLDTQGSELEILQGATDTIDNSVVAIMSEVEFIPVYKDQPLFGDIVAYLASRGFDLASLETFPTSGASNRTPIGLRGKGFPQGGEALFLRRPETLENHPMRDALLLKQAFIAFVFDFFDQTHRIITSHPDSFIASLASMAGQKHAYILFLKAYAEIIASYPAFFPVKYSDVVGPERSAERFMSGRVTVDQEAIRSAYLGPRDHAEFMEDISKLLSDEFIGIEALANQFHLTDHAEQLRQNRRTQIDGVLKWLRMERTTLEPS
jgi:FkbM family methyltransferase